MLGLRPQISVSTAERVVNVYSVYYTDQVESLVDMPAAVLSLEVLSKTPIRVSRGHPYDG